MELQNNESKSVIAPLKKVTPLSKYLAMAIFIAMPFIGGWIGYNYAPEKVVIEEKILVKEADVAIDHVTESAVSSSSNNARYTSPNGFSLLLPVSATVKEESAQFAYSSTTQIKGDFGTMCISPGYGCGGKGAEGARVDTMVLTSQDGIEMNVTILRGNGNNSVAMIVQLLKPLPSRFSDSAQIQVFTTEENLPLAESILTSIKFLN